MKLFKFALVLMVFATPTAVFASSVGDFALLDSQGKFHQLSYYSDQRAVVLYVHRNDSAQVKADLGELSALAADDVVVLMLNPDNGRDAITADASALGTDIPILFDEGKFVAQALGVARVGETLVIDPTTMTLKYQGAVAGAAQVLAGQEVAAQEATGPLISFAESHPVSYSSDIVPILEKNCVSCHHEGGIGPWAMNSHTMVRGFSPMMKEVVLTRRMPPGQIDTHVSKPILNTAGLSLTEKSKLLAWIDAGAPMDGDSDPLTELTFSNARFSMGEPDLVYTVPAQSIPATGIIDYRYVPVELNLDRDVWVSAMEFVPGDQEVLHHVIAYVSSPADKSVRGRETGAAQGESVGGFAPGRPGERFRDNSGRLIKKGSNLLLQMHYTTSGRETVDETQIGIFLHDKPPAYVMRGGVAGQRRFLVPPGAKEHELQGEELIEGDAYLYAMMPHMHYRGKRMSYTALYPDGTSELLLSVPKYDFNWQFSYELAEPVFLPAGTRLLADGAMDNSAQNPSNPDPTKPVHFGLQTKHEMFFGFTTIRYVGDTPDKLVAEKAKASPQDSAGR
ncbi:MAG: redoxin domain-containing protein [Pseudomonadales bacterium]